MSHSNQIANGLGMLTAEEVGEILCLSAYTVKKLARLGVLTGYRFGYRTLRFKKNDIEQFIERRKQ